MLQCAAQTTSKSVDNALYCVRRGHRKAPVDIHEGGAGTVD
jgi:hypothetical protein